jgi:hypothetical protein
MTADSKHPRTWTVVTLAACALACGAPGRAPETAPVHAEKTGPRAPEACLPAPVREPAPGAPPSATEPTEIGAAVGEVEGEFEKLLATMGVRFSADAKTLEVSGWVNMQSGLVEVFACAPLGKTHESVVVLDCVPSGLYAGLLALGLEPGTPVEFGTGDAYRPPTGDAVDIEVRWRDELGAEHVARAEDWIWDDHRKTPMPRAPWIFAGSFLQPVSGTTDSITFAADYVKSLATTYHDASSILENPHVEGIDDAVYFANEQAVPKVGTPITAIFRGAR